MSFIIQQPESAPIPAVRENPEKWTALFNKVHGLFIDNGVTKDTPVDIFVLAVTIRADLPVGLEAGDFDGDDLQNIVNQIWESNSN